MTPQAMTILAHLMQAGPLTGVEAEQVYRVRHLPARIFELRNAGHRIHSAVKHDATGQRYTRYSIA
jgi:hypothetical protein